MGIAPLHMVQLIATWVGDFPPCPDPISFIKLIKGAILSNLSSLKIANLGPPGLSPFFVYLPAAKQCSFRQTHGLAAEALLIYLVFLYGQSKAKAGVEGAQGGGGGGG